MSPWRQICDSSHCLQFYSRLFIGTFYQIVGEADNPLSWTKHTIGPVFQEAAGGCMRRWDSFRPSCCPSNKVSHQISSNVYKQHEHRLQPSELKNQMAVACFYLPVLCRNDWWFILAGNIGKESKKRSSVWVDACQSHYTDCPLVIARFMVGRVGGFLPYPQV